VAKSRPAKWSLKQSKTQYVMAFLAGIATVFLIGFFFSSAGSPIFQPAPYSAALGSGYFWHNVIVETAGTLVPAALFGAAFWLFGAWLDAQGLGRLSNSTLTRGSLAVAALFLVGVLVIGAMSNVIIQTATFYAVPLIDIFTVLFIGLWFDAGWWLVKRKQ
jgi:hypothetical protein